MWIHPFTWTQSRISISEEVGIQLAAEIRDWVTYRRTQALQLQDAHGQDGMRLEISSGYIHTCVLSCGLTKTQKAPTAAANLIGLKCPDFL
jgi:hypothetical protein